MAFQSKPPGELRIASFLPAATEMAYALGLEDRLVAVTHECDFPPNARNKPVLVRPIPELLAKDPAAIDQVVREKLRRGESLYALEEEKLRVLAPDLILAQDLCQVCAPSGNEASRFLASLDPVPEVLYLSPHGFEEVLKGFLVLGEKTGTQAKASSLVEWVRGRLDSIRARVAGLRQPRVFFMEWVDPPYCAGHWIAEMVSWAGGWDPLARPKADSVRVAWKDILRQDPEVLVVAPCGFNAATAAKQAEALKRNPGWKTLAARKSGKVFAVDANSYFARPSLRLLEGVELLAHLFHPEDFPWQGARNAFLRL